MTDRLAGHCRTVDGGRAFRWAFDAVPVDWASFVSFALLKSMLLLSGFVADSAAGRVLAGSALVLAFIAEEMTTGRVVIAATDTEAVVFDAARGFPHARPTAVTQRVARGDVLPESMGIFSDRWRVDGRSVRISRRHRAVIHAWIDERPHVHANS